MKVHEFDKHLKKAGGHIGRNVVEMTINMKTIVRKPLLIKILKTVEYIVTAIPIVIGALGTVTKRLEMESELLEISERIETFQTKALLRLARIVRKVLETRGDLLSLRLQ